MADVELAVHQRAGSRDVRAGLDLLDLLALGQTEHVDDGVASAERREPVADRRRAVDVVAGLEDPVGLPGRGVEVVETVIVGADEHRLARAVGRPHPVGARKDLVLDAVAPELLAGRGVDGEKVGVLRAEIDTSVEHQRRPLDRSVGLERPDLLAGGEVDAEEVGIAGAEEHLAADDRRRGFHRAAGLEGPLQHRLVRQPRVAGAGERRLSAEHRPIGSGMDRDDSAKGRQQRGEAEAERGRLHHGGEHFARTGPWQRIYYGCVVSAPRPPDGSFIRSAATRP